MSERNIVLIGPPSVAEVAADWNEQYMNQGRWKTTNFGEAQSIYNRILQCSTLEEVDAIIGNDSWTRHRCDGCGARVRTAVNMLERDYETTPTFCRECIETAAKLFAVQPLPAPPEGA